MAGCTGLKFGLPYIAAKQPSPFRSHAIPLASSAPALLWTHELFGLALAQILGRLLEQKCRELHRLDAHAPMLPDLGRDLLESLERSRCQRDEPPLGPAGRSEEHTSELQSQFHLVCRLLLEK